MKFATGVSSAVLLHGVFVFAQSATPGLPAAQPSARPAVAPLAKADPNDAKNAGRQQLYKYLDDIAASDETQRRTTVAAVHTRAQAEARQLEVRKKILSLIGGLPERTPLNARVLGMTQADGFRVEKVLFDSQPNFPVTALFYLPDAHPARLPAIVMAPGHGATGKAGDVAMASTFAHNGFAVLSYDPIGQGERLQYPDPAHPGQSLATRPTGEHGEAGLQPTLIGDAVARYFAWDGMRAVDYLQSRAEVDPDRIGAFGCSGGGAMTALLGALDSRVKAIGTACYLTSFDTLLPSIGAQDAEQSIPGFIASGLGFPDWVELAAPRPYAMIGTVSDMFPWAGFLKTATEGRRFYSVFDALAAGKPTGQPLPPTPTGPTLNPDTSNTIGASAPFQVITGIGGHGNLRPITSQIISFFLVHLAHSDAAPIVTPVPPPGAGPAAQPGSLPADALQVTPTGQVATSYPGSETVYSLNLKRGAEKLPKNPKPLTLPQLQTAVREVTHASAQPNSKPPENTIAEPVDPLKHAGVGTLLTDPGIAIAAEIATASSPRRRPATLLLTDHVSDGGGMKDANTVYLAITPRPSPAGTEETKSPILGPFYLTELRAELVGKTILGMRVDDVIRAIDYLAARPDVDPNNITAIASGHLGLVLLHAAVLDPRLKHITIDHSLESYASLLKAPMPMGSPEDVLPGVLLHYDIPDLVRALGPRVTFNDPLPGTANLSQSDAGAPSEHP